MSSSIILLAQTACLNVCGMDRDLSATSGPENVESGFEGVRIASTFDFGLFCPVMRSK